MKATPKGVAKFEAEQPRPEINGIAAMKATPKGVAKNRGDLRIRSGVRAAMKATPKGVAKVNVVPLAFASSSAPQ